ncbi:helix-turn-helix transcriptional regulator [Lentzea sp. NPDC005914]|uniref:helix-turn-helix domain-containing protein n=1 Tax=Lentzea sp. NPDC005914 TaxID=3154572 RepID=UPI0034071345
MTATISTPYSRELGDELRRLRETCTSLNGRAMAIQMGWDPSKVSDIELGKARASDVDLIQYLATCGKNLDLFEEFRRRYHNAFDLYFAQVPDNVRTLAMTESMAKKIVSYDVLTVHGLVQTEAYARQLFVDSHVEAPDGIEMLIEARMDRQTIMRRPNRPECVFYLHELALRLLLGDAGLRKDQYKKLMWSTHVLRIVPADICAYRSAATLYEFGKASPVVYTETDTAQVYAQDSVAIARTRRLFQRLDAVALDAEQSKSKLAEYVSGLREDPHVGGTDLA